jgi:hypothetical protein
MQQGREAALDRYSLLQKGVDGERTFSMKAGKLLGETATIAWI